LTDAGRRLAAVIRAWSFASAHDTAWGASGDGAAYTLIDNLPGGGTSFFQAGAISADLATMSVRAVEEGVVRRSAARWPQLEADDLAACLMGFWPGAWHWNTFSLEVLVVLRGAN